MNAIHIYPNRFRVWGWKGKKINIVGEHHNPYMLIDDNGNRYYPQTVIFNTWE